MNRDTAPMKARFLFDDDASNTVVIGSDHFGKSGLACFLAAKSNVVGPPRIVVIERGKRDEP